ncbi:MAG: energy transducer TonB [Gammaproteobacteria bacterium]|nr:energy transducer TonB [Gammaproteobacteria bacterium]
MDVGLKIAAAAALIRSPALRRGLLSCLFSAVITAGLLLLMRHFVATTDAAYQEGPPAQKLVFSRTVEDPEPPARRKRVEPPPVLIEPPRPLPDDIEIGEEGEPTHFDPVEPVIEQYGRAVSDARMPIPFLTPAPEYPQRALARGLEGWVLVSFTIAASGAVADPMVVDADPPGVFDAAALRAVMRYRYRPQIVAGVPTATPGMLLRIHFELED